MKEITSIETNTLIKEQTLLQQEIQNKAGINIVTCGNCGTVILHRMNDKEITCFDCKITSEPCDFPNLNY